MSDHGHFKTALEVTWLPDEAEWELIAPLVFEAAGGEEFIVPVGRRTDLASIPRVLRSFAFSEPKTREPAVIHDSIYRTGTLSRKDGDQVFWEALRANGVNAFSAWLYWLAVRLFGWIAWRRSR